ncbi:MAG: GlnD UTase protein, partial [Bacteroidetes bacterium]|nr:GlnD UTase protein [Bacteroidota bacterium]
MTPNPQSLKAFLTERRGEIEAAHKQGASGFNTCTALTALADEVLRQAFDTLSAESQKNVALLALGGYGRGELCPKSDVDIMVLCPSGDKRESSAQAATEFLHLLWDAGMDIGHSVRTMEEALALRGQTHDAWASVLESRFVCGSEPLAGQLFDALSLTLAGSPDIWFIEGVFDDIGRRHDRFGNSVKLLEPNVKKSAGGLRDLQAIFWLFRATDAAWFSRMENGAPVLHTFLDQLQLREVIEKDERDAALAALEFLLRVRHEMHFRRAAAHDTLEYALQLEVAEGLGFGSRAELRSVEVFMPVEVFMREYYLHARTIHGLHRRLVHRFKEMAEPPASSNLSAERVGEFFFMKEDLLSVDPAVTRFRDAREIFAAFCHAAEHEMDLDFRLRAVIERSADLITEPDR